MTYTHAALGAGGVLLTLATLAAASGPSVRAISPTSTPDTVRTEDAPPPSEAAAFSPGYAHPISDDQWARITATGTWRPECPVNRDGLTNVSVPFFGMDGMFHRGTITVKQGRRARHPPGLQHDCVPTLPDPAGRADRELRRLGHHE